MSGAALPPTPQINADTTIWGFKFWFDKAQKFFKANADTNLQVYTSNFMVDPDNLTYYLYYMDTTAGFVFATLPSAIGNRGKKYLFKKVAGNNYAIIRVAIGTSDTIGGSFTQYLMLAQGESVELLSDGVSKWNIVATYGTSADISGGYSNLAVNGGFEIWQSGTSQIIAASTVGRSGISTGTLWALPDHWWFRNNDTANSYQITQQPGFGELSRYCMRAGRPGSGGVLGSLAIGQELDSDTSIPLSAQQHTLTFTWRKGATFSGSLAIQLRSGTGINQLRRNAAYTGEFILASITLTSASPDGTYTITGPSPASSQVTIFMSWTPVGTATATDYFELDNVQWNIGQNTAFEQLSFEEDRARCLSWVQKSFNYAQTPVQNVGSTTGAYNTLVTKAGLANNTGHTVSLTPALREGSTLTAITYNPSAANAFARDVGTGTDTASTTVVGQENLFRIDFRAIAGQNVGDQIAVHYVIDGGL